MRFDLSATDLGPADFSRPKKNHEPRTRCTLSHLNSTKLAISIFLSIIGLSLFGQLPFAWSISNLGFTLAEVVGRIHPRFSSNTSIRSLTLKGG